MKLTIESLSHKPLQFFNDLPSKYPGPRLPGGEVLSASGDFGDLCIQEFDGGNFIIRYSVLRTKEAFILDVQSHHSGLHAFIMLKNSIAPVFKTGEKIEIAEKKFTLFQADHPSATVNFRSQQHFICFETLLSHELATSLISDFPELAASLTAHPSSGHTDIWVDPAQWTDDEVSEHIHYILTYSDPVKWRRNYFENRVWDITWKLLALHLNKDIEEEEVAEVEMEKAQMIQRLILDNLDQHLLIRELSKKVGASESKLKKIFKCVFGMAIHQYRIAARLKEAIRLLDEGKSVKEAAAATGWRPADLINAYYKVYGTTPGTIRKKKR
jgi:AraC-like DNA-binding protein